MAILYDDKTHWEDAPSYNVAWDYIRKLKEKEAQESYCKTERHGYIKTEVRLHWMDWEVGKVYFRESGTAPFVLTSKEKEPNRRDMVTYQAEYISGGQKVEDSKQYLIEATSINITKENDMNTLYEFDNNGKQTFGTKIAVNSSGLWVMEVKGTGEVLTVDKAKVEEVIPHSIGVKFLGNSQVYHYLAPKDKFTKGFYLFTNQSGTNLVEVIDLDTKSKQATKDFTPSLKFVTEVVDNSK